MRTPNENWVFYCIIPLTREGTGKTMIAAFDYKNQIKNGDKRLLFLAHRKEILHQSVQTFRNVLKDQNFGELWVEGNNPEDFTHVFASIQTLNSNENYLNFLQDYFEYIVIDESHHASASSYLRILEYFKPKILLGLTATPERMDGKNILDYFNNRIASEIRLTDAIQRKLLSPFHYFGVTDSEDLSHLKWSRGGYEISELENVYTKSKQRVQVILDAMKRYLRDMKTFKAIGFCVSIKHANFMADSFNKVGIPSIALHSDSEHEERNTAKSKLQKGQINCIFTVDLFNEGVDIPDIDTVLFLRPTESLTVFIQQLGRGLRLSENKETLTVLDFVGQAHANYDFSFKLRALIGKTNEHYIYPMRQGVLYIENKHTDLFFITINKNEEDYLPSTMYNDYAKNSELFNWESQSTTSIQSPTGQRYINDRSKEHKVLLFVRELKTEYGKASPYIFIGNARYISHEGSNPIQIVWKMEHLIPERIIRESRLRVIN